MKTRVLTILLLLMLAQSVAAQDLFTGTLASTREMLLYRKQAGDYLVTVQGERFIDRAYLEITLDGQQVSPDSVVTVTAEPQKISETGVDEETALGKGSTATYTAEYRDGLFVVAPMNFDATGVWLLTITVDGEHSTAFQTRIYPRKPDAPVAFNIANLGVPVAVLIGLLGFFQWRRIPLMQ